MPWKQIKGQENAKSLLQRATIEGRVSHAYLFLGIPGIGKEAMAIEFAKLLNCSAPIEEGRQINACGTCPSCKKIDKLQHPNMDLVFALPAGTGTDPNKSDPYAKLSDAQIKEINATVAEKAGNQYQSIEIPRASQIKIASIRYIKKKLSLSATQRGRRCVLVFDCEKMTGEAANAFLKTLEEPNDNVTIILISSRPELLLQTILSRCQVVHFEPLSDEIIQEYLIENHHLLASESRIISKFAQGSISSAVDFLDDDMRQLREESIAMMRTSIKKNYRVELMAKIDSAAKTHDKNKLHIMLSMMAMWINDVISLVKLENDSELNNFDQAEVIAKFATAFHDKELAQIIDIIENTRKKLNFNVQPQNALLSLFLRIRQILLGITT
jgi:DNA polymerase III subunit delta'